METKLKRKNLKWKLINLVISVSFPLYFRRSVLGNVDWVEVSLLLGCSSLRDWMDDGFFLLQWHCGRDQREVEEVDDGLTEDWCSYTQKPCSRDAMKTHSMSKTVRRIRPIILFFCASSL